MLSDLTEQNLVVYLLSGGGSAICERPLYPAVSEADLHEFFRQLVTCGADIVQMNVFAQTRFCDQGRPAGDDGPPG